MSFNGERLRGYSTSLLTDDEIALRFQILGGVPRNLFGDLNHSLADQNLKA